MRFERRGFGGGRRFGGEGRSFGGGRSFDRDRDDNTPKPVKVGEEYDVEISEVGSRGDGIARVNNFVVFINGAKQGEKAKVKITEVRNRFAIAEKVGAGAATAAAAPEAAAPESAEKEEASEAESEESEETAEESTEESKEEEEE